MEKETPNLEDSRPHPNLEAYIREKNIKKGLERLERHPGTGTLGSPKKAGHGGKYTWEGPEDDGELEPAPPAIDERDPNYVDDAEDVANADADVVVGAVEVPKAPSAPLGVSRVEVKPLITEQP